FIITKGRSTIGSTKYSDNHKSNRETTTYANVVEKFLSHYYPAMKNAPAPKEVAKVILQSIEAPVVYSNLRIMQTRMLAIQC
ncbi:MAG: hypothetical protein ACJ71J_16475, partial [Nitrososphaeraceae archaeon]